MNEFGKAVDIVSEIKKMIEIHGEDLRLAFHLDESMISEPFHSVIGAVRLDGVELTDPPRLDLSFKV